HAAPPPPAPRPPRHDYLRQSAAVVAPSTCRAAAALPTQEPFQLLRPALSSILSSPRTWRRVRENRSEGRVHSRGRGHTLTIGAASFPKMRDPRPLAVSASAAPSVTMPAAVSGFMVLSPGATLFNAFTPYV